jgi:hypothetical protein
MTQTVSVSNLRKELAFHMNGQDAILIGDHWHHRAILVPLSRSYAFNHQDQRKAIARAAKAMLRVLSHLRAQHRT